MAVSGCVRLNQAVSELTYFHGPMACGKSTLALQVDYTQTQAGRSGRVFTCLDRSGEAQVASRIGLVRPAIEVSTSFDFWRYTLDQLVTGHRVDYFVCDEAQFYSEGQIDQLARIVDELNIDVFCFGLLTDFRSKLFEASARLVELCDRMELVQVQPLCWCGRVATHNARTVHGNMVTEGNQVEVGDVEGSDAVRYEVLCRRHHQTHVTAARAQAVLGADPLPFDGDEQPSLGAGAGHGRSSVEDALDPDAELTEDD